MDKNVESHQDAYKARCISAKLGGAITIESAPASPNGSDEDCFEKRATPNAESAHSAVRLGRSPCLEVDETSHRLQSERGATIDEQCEFVSADADELIEPAKEKF